MRALDIIRQKRRFEMFSEKTKEKVLELNSFFGKYHMHFEERIKKTFIYYDTPDNDLLKSNIVLYKTVIGNFCELNMATEKISSTFRYSVRTNYKHFTKQIKQFDSILRHKEFLIDSFKAMFLSSINFDPEFLLKKLQQAYTIRTVSNEYRSTNGTGLKITYSFDQDIYTNEFTKQKVNANILTIYQHSNNETDGEFDNLIGKLERYLKELNPTSDTKIMIARRMTSARVLQMEREKQRREEQRRLEEKKREKQKRK